MDYKFTHKPSADMLYRTKLIVGASHSHVFRVPKAVFYFDMENDVDPDPKLRQRWQSFLGSSWTITRVGPTTKFDFIFFKRLMDAKRYDIAEFFAQLIWSSSVKTQGWVLNKNFELTKSLDPLVAQKEFVHTHFFAQQSATRDPMNQIGLHMFCVHYRHWLLAYALEALTQHYRKCPDYASEFYTSRLWNGLLHYFGFQLEHDTEHVTNSYIRLYPYHYAPNLNFEPSIPDKYKHETIGYLPVNS